METITVSGSVSGFVPQPSASGKPFLLNLVRGISKAVLIDHIMGNVDAAHQYLSLCARNTLRAMLGHLGEHSDRVWATYICLGLDIIRNSKKADSSKDQKAKYAERGVKELEKLGFARKIVEEKELLAGPGEHDYLAAGGEKRGLGGANHYELLLHQFVAPWFIKLWTRFLHGVRQSRPHPSEPPADLEAVWSGRAEFEPVQVPQLDSDELDPFAPDYAERLEARRALAEFKASISQTSTDFEADSSTISVSSPACTRSLSIEPPTSHEPCNVMHNDRNNEGEQGSGAKPNALSRRSFFGKTNLSGIPKLDADTHTHVHEGVDNGQQAGLTADRASLMSVLTRGREQGGFGLDFAGANKALTKAPTLEHVAGIIEYIRWHEQDRGREYARGEVYNTITSFGGYPADYQEHKRKQDLQREKEQKRAERQAKPLTTVREGIAEPLRGIWPTFLEQVRTVEGITPGFWATNLIPLRNVTLKGDLVTIETLFPQSYIKLTGGYTDTFADVLTRLLGKPVSVMFIKPKGVKY